MLCLLITVVSLIREKRPLETKGMGPQPCLIHTAAR